MIKTVKSHFAVAIAVIFCVLSAAALPAAAGESRTLSLYMVHTKENLTVTYKKNGRYIPSAMKKLNHFLRDWRRNKSTRMDPKTIDLMWELHADLGSRKPVHIISGFRSPSTNAMLRKIGRKVARRSQHIRGKAIDMYFPDVPTSRVRGSALVRRIGGVGYYPRSGKSGFVHIDSGTVRHWPRVSKTRMAKILRKHKKTVGARLYRKGQPAVMVASAGPTKITPNVQRARAASVHIPVPRPRPMEVLMAAAAADGSLQITPASAEVPSKNFGAKPSVIRDNSVATTASLGEMIKRTLDIGQRTNRSAKGSFAAAIRKGDVTTTPLIRPLVASAQRSEEDEKLWWPMRLFTSVDSLMRRDGAPQPFTNGASVASLSEADEASLQRIIASLTNDAVITETSAPVSGKADKLIVNRTGKGDLVAPASLPVMKRRTSQYRSSAKSSKVASSEAAVLLEGVRPLTFE